MRNQDDVLNQDYELAVALGAILIFTCVRFMIEYPITHFKVTAMDTLDYKHPDSLRTFFLTEMWERYGFYVVQTLLVLYLTFHFHWEDTRAFELVGAFTALTYISSLVGGWIADHLLGQKTSIILATIILMISYSVLALLQSAHGLLIALAGVCVGTGLLKPNISSLLGNEYPPNSPRREVGFTIFYIGITTGIILGSTLPNLFQQRFGWHVAFFSAAMGMVFALLIFCYGIYRYKLVDYYTHDREPKKIAYTSVLILGLYYIALEIFNHPNLGNMAFSIIVLFCVSYLIYAAKTAKGMQASQNVIIALLCIISTLFWAFYFQMFSSFSLLITRIVSPTLLGISFPAPYYVAVQSFGLIILGILFSRPKHHASISTQAKHIGNKFLMAMIVMTLAYAFTTLILYFNMSEMLLSPLLILPLYLMISAAELLLSPVGLAAITLLSSPNKVSTMMGIFFVTLGTGGFLSGKLASLAAAPSATAPIEVLKQIYAVAFGKMLGILILATVLCFFVTLLIQYLLRDNLPPKNN